MTKCKSKTMLVQLVILVSIWCLMSPLLALPVYQRLLFFPEISKSENLLFHFEHLTKLCTAMKSIKFSSKNGKQLSGCLLVHSDTAPVILLSHGNAGNLSHRTILAEAILQAGFSVFLYDYQGYGCSEGQPTIKGVVEDAVSAYDYLVSTEHIPSSQIVVYGESLGCGVTAELSKVRSVRAIILQSGFPSLTWAAHDRLWFTWLYPQSWFPDLDCLAAVKASDHAPVVLIHGTEDSAFPVSYSQLLYDRASQKKKLVIVEKMKHNLDRSDLPTISKVVADLRQTL